jgi:predicted transposase YdaD
MEAEDNRRGSKTMTDEERQKLCENLRDRNNVAYQDCEDAALEIERLAEENTWRWRLLVAEWKAGSLNWKTVLSLAGLRWIRFLR